MLHIYIYICIYIYIYISRLRVNIKHFHIDTYEYARLAKTELLSIHRLLSASTANRNLKMARMLSVLELVKT